MSTPDKNQRLIQSLFGDESGKVADSHVFDRMGIIKALVHYDAALGRHPILISQIQVKAVICMVGGAAIMLKYGSRISTHDIDASVWPHDNLVSKFAAEVAQELKLPPDWINDAAKQYFPENAEFEECDLGTTFANCTIKLASDKTLLAMKCMALRDEVDIADIRTICRHMGVVDANEAVRITESMYGKSLSATERNKLHEVVDAALKSA